MSKPTVATLKAFVKKNRASLLIKVVSDFDGMEDGVRQTGATKFLPAQAGREPSHYAEHTLGINGVWLVGRSRDYVSAFSEGGLTGYEVTNSCGSFIVAVAV
jgi:hypothetical protein